MRILIADDHPHAREAMAFLVRRIPGMEVVGEAADGDEAVRAVRRLRPDLVLMDIGMPRCDGLLATRLIKRECPHVRVVVFTVCDRPEEFWEAIRSGAQGYLVKSLPPGQLVEALRALARDDVPLSPGTAAALLAAIRGEAPASPTEGGSGNGLTERERDVAHLVARGLTNREIAQRLCLSEHTVKNHVKRLLAKTGARNRTELVQRLVRHG